MKKDGVAAPDQGSVRNATDRKSLIERLEFIANYTHQVIPEEIEEVCDLAADAIRALPVLEDKKD